MIKIRWFRAVVSVSLALALLLPSAVVTVPSARAQQGAGYGAPMGVPGGYPPGGFGGGDFGFGGGFGYGAGFYPSYPAPTPPPLSTADRGPVTPGVCTSQTYQTLAVPRGAEVRNVAIKTTATQTTSEFGTKADIKKEEIPRPDLDALSPIEAAFQVGATPGHALAQIVFDAARPVSGATQPPAPYMPIALPTPPPAPVEGKVASTVEAEAAVAKAVAATQMPQPQQGVSAAPSGPVTRFLGPFGTPLRQYGYAVFSSYVSTFAPIDDVPVGPDYVVGPGDNLTISIWGPVENSVIRTVDRNGQILLPRVGDLRVWGLTFAQADRLIREQLGRYFRGFQTSVTMGRLRTLRINIIGEVCQPGSYTLNSLATMTQALYSAGGPTKMGSLRHVRLLRNSHVVGEIDLYDFLLRGDRTRDFRLESGDTIFVPTVGDVAAIAGEVKRPAIYEVHNDVRLADLVEVAGGVTPSSYMKRVQIVRAQPNAERITVDVDLSNYYLKGDMDSNPPVHAGDLVLIHKNEGRIYNTVKVEGAVKYPGIYELKPMMRLSQLVPADRLVPEAYTDRVEIARRRPDYSVEVITVNLRKAWSGDLDQDHLLRANDEVTVRTEMRATRTMTLGGQVMRPGTYVIGEGERLSSVLERAGGFTSRAYLKGAVFTRASLRKIEQEQLNAFVRVQEQRILAEASQTVVGTEKEDAAVTSSVVQARRDFLRALASRVALGRMVIKLNGPEQLKNSHEDVVLVDGDSLEVPEPVDSVLVLGSVRNSTSVLHAPNGNVDYYVNRVGGYSKEADKKEIHIVKADGSAVAGFSNIRTVEPGDTIIVPRSEDSKIRLLPTIRDGFSIFGSTLSTVASLAALAVLFR
jgi:protein involved in polysaccharide export with SLBB domain